MSSFNSDMLVDLLATMQQIERPWASFIGLVELRQSPYVERGQAFALNAAVAGFPELGQSAVIHPDDIETLRSIVASGARRTVTDAELAAFTYWFAYQSRARSEF